MRTCIGEAPGDERVGQSGEFSGGSAVHLAIGQPVGFGNRQGCHQADTVAREFTPDMRLGPVYVSAAQLQRAAECFTQMGASADALACFEQQHRVACDAQVAGRGHTGKTGTDHGDVVQISHVSFSRWRGDEGRAPLRRCALCD
ncbi:hypothetical protein D3C72_2041710 [compost metagenome]